MKLSTALVIVCIAMLLISCASVRTTQSPFWNVDIDTFMGYVAEKEVADFEGIWDIDGNYTVGVLREGTGYIGFTLDSVFEDWKPRMVKFKVETIDDLVRTTWYMRDHSLRISSSEVTLLGDNFLAIAGNLLERVDSKFPSNTFDLSSDAEFVVQMVEEIHPIFIMEGMLADDYAERRSEYLTSTKTLLHLNDFLFATARYTVALKDAHMNYFAIYPNELDVEFVYQDRKMYLHSQPSAEVLEIAGIPIKDILDEIDNYVYFENESARILKYPEYVRNEVIFKLMGVEAPETRIVPLTLLENEEQATFEVPFVPITHTHANQPNYIIRNEMIEDIFFISLTRFIDGDHITEVAEEIEKAVENGIWRFIIDLRGNPGGNSDAGDRLLQAMGISLPAHGGVLRDSEEIRDIFELTEDDFDEDGRRISTPSSESENPNNVFVSVLSNRNSFSSAHFLMAKVQDGKLGNIIGEPSSNSPSSFGQMTYFPTPIIKQQIWVSTTWFLRPDANADQNTLVPDILVPSEDALDTAVEYLRRLER